jgi:hypothetical protein
MTYNTAQLSEEALSLLLRLLYSSGYTEVDEDQGEYYCSYTYSNGRFNAVLAIVSNCKHGLYERH